MKCISAREEHVLLAVIALGGEATHLGITRRLDLAYGYSVKYAVLSDTLAEMVQKGLLVSTAIRSSPDHDTVSEAYYRASNGAVHALAYREQRRDRAKRVRRVLAGDAD